MRISIILFFYLNTVVPLNGTTVSNFDNNLNNFYDAVINFEFTEAKNIASNKQDKYLRELLRTLSDLLYFYGQEQSSKKYSINSKSNLPEHVILKNLIYGYDELFHKPREAKSLSYFFKAYQQSKKLQNQALTKLSLMGILEFYHFEYSQTNDQFLKYLDEYQAMVQTPAEQVWSFIYEIYFKSQNILENKREAIKAINSLEKLIQLHKKNKLSPLYLSLKAVQLEFIGKRNDALKYHFQALKESQDFPFLKYIKFRTCIRLSNIYYNFKEYEQGLFYVEEAKKYIDLSDTLLSQLYIKKYASINNKGLKKWELAFNQYEEAMSIEDKLDLQENTYRNSKLEIQLQTAEKEARLAEQQIEIETQKRKEIKTRTTAIGLGTLLLFGTITFLLIQKNTKRKQLLAEQEKELQVQKVGSLMKEQELVSIDAMIAGQEKERQRIANDLHDDLGGMMATVKLHFNTLKDKPSSELYSKTDKLLDEAYQKVRSIAHAKNSGVIAKHGLLKSVKDMATKVSATGKIVIDVVDHGLDNRLENSLELTIFRIVQELTTNVIKHAHASEVTIHFTQHDSSLNIMVEDNGKGFNPKKIKKSAGMGLHSIDKRIDHLNGTLNIESEPEKGTTIIIDIPI